MDRAAGCLALKEPKKKEVISSKEEGEQETLARGSGAGPLPAD
jgi:hypothetical protein